MANKDNPTTATDFYSKGNEAFVSESYPAAIELYSSALGLEPHFAECMVARAHAYIKADKFDLAKKDADKAIDILRASSETSPTTAKAFLRSGVASFHLGRYREAKNCFTEGQKLGEESGLKQWMAWCDEKIKKFGDFAPGVKPATAEPKADNKEVVTAPAKAASPEVTPPSDTAAPAPDPHAMPVPKISHDWYQTETHVVVEVRIKKLSADQCKVEMGDTTLSVTAKLAVGSEYSLELDLAHPILPLQSSYKIMSTKLEVKLKKAEGVRWSVLEGDGSAPLPGGSLPPPTAAVKAPYASGRDWSAIEKTLEAEAEEKKEGEAALNEMFQKIYGDANDEVKRAMNKSFQESGGTVLSTNWNEIGKEKTEVKPPDGMEWKKYD
jgi:suppressor of G2 allele of SKP1